MTQIPLATPDFDEREVSAVRRVLESGWVVQGPEVEAFENDIAQMHDAHHCIAVSSGTAALHVSFLAMEIGPGDAVFIPSFAWPSAANMAMMVGARPVFVDVFPDTFNIDPVDLESRIEQCRIHGWGNPRAIVPVHEFGLAADMQAVARVAQRLSLDIIEDAACALGATYEGRPIGTMGKLGIFSFHPRKSVTTGEGGAIVTNDGAIAERCRVWRNHGQLTIGQRRDFPIAGFNYRMTEFQAAIGRVQLDKFSGILRRRRDLAQNYLDVLMNCSSLRRPVGDDHTWQTFLVLLEEGHDRDAIVDRLRRRGIGAGAGSVAAHCLSVYAKKFDYDRDDLPISSRLHDSGLALPLYASMTTDQIAFVARQLTELLTNSTAGEK